MKRLGKPNNKEASDLEQAIVSMSFIDAESVQYEPAVSSVVSPIHRGVENACYKIKTPESNYFLRIRFSDMSGFFNEKAVAEATHLAGEIGIGPKLIHLDTEHGVLLLEYLDENWAWGKLDNFKDNKILENTIDAKKKFHNSGSLSQTISVFEKIDQYWKIAISQNIYLPKIMHSQKDKIQNIQDALMAAGVTEKPCHGDGVASNIMISKTQTVKLVDFDEAGNNDPYHDLGSLILEVTQFDEQAKQIVEIYEGQFRVEILNRCFLYGIADDFKWSLWAFINSKKSKRKEIEFSKYAQWRLLRSQWNLNRQDFTNLLRKL